MFEEVKKNFGFGCMRLPMKDGEVDEAHFNEMIDAFIGAGFNYFDTAHGYLDGKSEIAIGRCLAGRYPRDKFILTNKLTDDYFACEDEIRPFFESQLKVCGVEYFDFYLMHAQRKAIYEYFKKNHAYEHALEFKKEGKIKHFGISFHDRAEVLEEILTEYPQIEVVQIQLNYVDFDDPAVQSKKCYDVCRKFNKPIIVMEPVKGGNLVNLPTDARKYLDEVRKESGASYASYAMRFAAGFDGIFMTLSGMSNMEQMRDNISYMTDFKPLGEAELAAIGKVCEVFKQMNLIPCTACRYCTAGCPKNISIPDLFACMNTKKIYNDWNVDYYYNKIHSAEGNRASDCIGCGKCEKSCPQHLPVRQLLKDVAREFEGK